MTILVTGASGFIGQRLIARLLVEHAASDIVCLVRPSADGRERAARLSLRAAGVRILQGDLTVPLVSREAPPKVDIVFHLAANIDTAGSEADLAVNDLGTLYLLSWLGSSVSGARVVYTSSIAVLDRDGPAEGPLNESSRCVPRTAYGRTKLHAEQILRDQAEEQNYRYTILRLGTVYGPAAKRDGLFDQLVQLIARHSVLGRLNWPGRTSIVHVDDVAAIMVELGLRPEADNEMYCIANPSAPTVGAIAEHIGRLVPEPVAPVRLPTWVWSMFRRLAWNPAVRAIASVLAPVIFWRLTLMVDDGFWCDTSKLQMIWTQPFGGLDDRLPAMIAAMMALRQIAPRPDDDPAGEATNADNAERQTRADDRSAGRSVRPNRR